MKGTPSARVTAAGLALGGLLLSALLEWLHVKAYGAPGASSFCTVGKRLDCTAVALASSSVVLGLPLPIWGILGFSALGVAAWLGSAWLVPLAFGAALASVALLGVELFDVGALCFLCEAVHAVAFALAVVAWRARRTLAPLADRERAALVLLPPLGGMIALLIFLPPYFRTVTFRGELPFADGVTPEGEPWIGAKNPKLTLEEYTDYRCPHCRTASSWTLHRLAAHPNDIRIVRASNRSRAASPNGAAAIGCVSRIARKNRGAFGRWTAGSSRTGTSTRWSPRARRATSASTARASRAVSNAPTLMHAPSANRRLRSAGTSLGRRPTS